MMACEQINIIISLCGMMVFVVVKRFRRKVREVNGPVLDTVKEFAFSWKLNVWTSTRTPDVGGLAR